MRRSLAVLILLLLGAAPGFGQSARVGIYKLVSFAIEIDGQAALEVMGKSPRGSLILMPTRWVHIITGENRKFGTSVEEKSALLDSLSAYTGPYRLDGNQIVVAVDASWNDNRTQVTRTWQRDGNRLSIATAPAPYSRDPSKMAITRVVWEKVE